MNKVRAFYQQLVVFTVSFLAVSGRSLTLPRHFAQGEACLHTQAMAHDRDPACSGVVAFSLLDFKAGSAPLSLWYWGEDN